MKLRALLLLAACGKSADSGPKPYREIELDTEHGLSGLAADATGALWTVSERADVAYRVTLAGGTPAVERFSVEGTPPKIDLEGIAWLGGDRFAFGTEGRVDGFATVLYAERRGQALVVTNKLELPAKQIGIELPANHGAEGLCGTRETLVVAIEGAGVDNGRRFAPIVRIERGAIVRTHRLWLTSKTGKISALDCTVGDGAVEVIAIERHFEITRLLRFQLPAGDGDITPEVTRDLGAVIDGKLNLEGIARTPDGRTYAITDNQWKMIQGPSLLLALE